MFLHCHNCEWEQDDFWSEGYNPIDGLKHLKELIFKNLDDVYLEADGPQPALTYREYIVNELYNTLVRVANMKWQTYEDYKKNSNVCPMCGSSALDID